MSTNTHKASTKSPQQKATSHQQILQALSSPNLASLSSQIILSPKTSNMVWMRCGGQATALFRPENTGQLQQFLSHYPFKENILVMGNGSNLIVRDGGFIGVIIKLCGQLAEVKTNPQNNTKITCGCGTTDAQISSHCTKEEIGGLEFLSTIPGTLGGNIRMNASCHGSQISTFLETIEYATLEGEIKTIEAKQIEFAYRNNPLKNVIFTKATLKGVKSSAEEIKNKISQLQKIREESQPQKCKTSGSAFVNPEGIKAWEVIDKCGFRGKSIGGATVSEKHANFIINTGTATATDVEKLGSSIQEEALQKMGIKLKWEIEFFGQNKGS